MNTPRIIKKYSNRRLYDTEISQYITLDEVKELVVKQIKFRVIENSTDEDMTNYVLLQIISEGESGRTPIFTTEILENIIRFYNNPLQKAASEVLEKGFSFLNNTEKTPFETMVEFTKRNVDLWQSAFSPPKKPDKSKTKDKKTPPK